MTDTSKNVKLLQPRIATTNLAALKLELLRGIGLSTTVCCNQIGFLTCSLFAYENCCCHCPSSTHMHMRICSTRRP